jgi:hypothetical protein
MCPTLPHRMVIGEIASRRLTPLKSLRFVSGTLSRTPQAVSRRLLPIEAKPRFDMLLAIIALHPRTTCGLQFTQKGIVPRPHDNVKITGQNLRQS